MSIILNKHQIEPTYKLLYKCAEQHGILLWYMMGTGKTIAALAFILNQPNKEVIIMCPNDLIFVWKNEMTKIKLNNKITFYSYENDITLDKLENIKDKILILDEVQHLILNLKTHIDTAKKISLIRKTYKTLALTGTPIYTEIIDLSYIINIVSDKNILPINYSEFKYKFNKVIKHRSAIFGYVIPITHILSYFFTLFLPIKEYIKTINDMIYKNKIIDKMVDILTIKGAINVDILKPFLPNIHDIPKDAHLFVKKEGLISITLFLLSMLFLLFTYFIYYKINDFRMLNTKKLTNAIIPYTLYYKVPLNVDIYPSSKRFYQSVSYSNYQMSKWIELTHAYISIDTIKDLNIKNEKDVEYYSKKIDIDTYKNNGVIIGNLSDPKGSFSPKFYQILKTSKGKRAVFYSSYTKNGICLFKKFLESEGINYLFLDSGITNEEKISILSKFKKTTTFLLLHPKYTEGITVYGAQQLHILEPITLIAKKEQIVARVIRYQSHSHLPVKERHVDVYQWACTNNSLLSKMSQNIISLKKWITLSPEVFYTVKHLDFEQDITPDSLVLKEELINIGNDKDITRLLQFENNKSDIDCCIKFPSKSQEKSCLVDKPSCTNKSKSKSKK